MRFGTVEEPTEIVAPPIKILPNVTPVIVLMDSTNPLRVYDPETRRKGGTNADDLTDILGDLPVKIIKETTSSMWHREHEILKQYPDLILIHRSCFFDATNLNDRNFAKDLYELTESKLIAFLGYIALGNPNTKFLVYSRGFGDASNRSSWTSKVEKRFPLLKGRIATMTVAGGGGTMFPDEPIYTTATFSDSTIANTVILLVRSLLNLEETK